LDVRGNRQTNFIVAALALVAAASLGVAYASNIARDNRSSPGASNQCDLPLEQRTGGWVCPTP
jgi:hypothetical protein